jgi:quercetin dioxygenase-like cupin family protein
MRFYTAILATFTIQLSAHAMNLPVGATASAVSTTSSAPEQAELSKPTEVKLPVQIFPADKAVVLRNPGKDSVQLLSVDNAPESKVTITSVTMAPGAVSDRHSHPISEQIWIVQKGTGTLLLDSGAIQEIHAGDVIRTPPKTTHGVKNTGSGSFEYISITTPPEDMTHFYGEKIEKK